MHFFIVSTKLSVVLVCTKFIHACYYTGYTVFIGLFLVYVRSEFLIMGKQCLLDAIIF